METLHSRHWPKATDLKQPFFHNDCGGRVERGGGYYDMPWQCACQPTRIWSDRVMRGFTAEQLAERFHLRPQNFDEEAVVMVTKVDGKAVYTAAVPASEAHKFKKAVL